MPGQWRQEQRMGRALRRLSREHRWPAGRRENDSGVARGGGWPRGRRREARGRRAESSVWSGHKAAVER
jgi:hypothetical protein